MPSNSQTPTVDFAEPAAFDAALAPGSIVAGRYEILRELGAGAMGTVYLATHRAIGRKVALKVLSAALAHTPDALRRFRSEARAASSIGHPNIVEVFDADELPDGRPFLVMELLAGRHLLDILEADGPMAWPRVCAIGARIARALAAAHAIGLIHRDLKSENVMLVDGPSGEQVKVFDFGIAVNIAGGGVRETTPGVAIGTPAYMAPEQAKGVLPTPAFDLYATGAVLYELLCGEPPFLDASPIELLAHKLNTASPSIATRVADLPLELVELVDACLAIDPSARPATATDVARRLEALIQDNGTQAIVEATRAPEREGHAPWWAIMAISAFTLGAVLIIAWPSARPANVANVVAPSAPTTTRPRTEPAELPSAPVERAPESAPPPAIAPVADTPAPIARSAKPKPTPPHEPTPTAADEGPAALPTPVPDVTPSVTPPAVVDEADTPACPRMRREAEDARNSHDWRGVLRHSSEAKCWPSPAERLKLRIKANMELAQFSECVRLGEGNQEVEVVKWVQICRKRLDGGG